MSITDVKATLEQNLALAREEGELTLGKLLKDTPLGADVVKTLLGFLQRDTFVLGKVVPRLDDDGLTVDLGEPAGLDAQVTLVFADAQHGLTITSWLTSERGVTLQKLGASLVALTTRKSPLKLPAGINHWDGLALQELALVFETGDKSLAHAELRVAALSPWAVPGVGVSLTGAALHLAVDGPRGKAGKRSLSGDVRARWELDGALTLDLHADLVEKDLVLTGHSDADLGAVAAHFGAALPASVRSASGSLDATVHTGQRTFELTSKAGFGYRIGQQSLTTDLDLHIERDEKGSLKGGLGVRKTPHSGPLTLLQGLDLVDFDLDLALEHAGGETRWTTDGSLGLSLAGTALGLGLTLDEAGALRLDGKADGQPVPLPGGLGTLETLDFDVTVPADAPPAGQVDAVLKVGPAVELDVRSQLADQRLRLVLDVPAGGAKLSDILDAMGVALPEQLPLVDAEGDFHVRYDVATAEQPTEFAVWGKVGADWDLHGARIPTTADFGFRREAVPGDPAGHRDRGHLTISAADGVDAPLTDFLSVSDVQLEAHYDAGTWNGHGELATSLLEKAFRLSADLHVAPGETSSLALVTADASKGVVLPIGELPGGGLASLDFHLEVVKQQDQRRITGGLDAHLRVRGIDDLGIHAGWADTLTLSLSGKQVDYRALAAGFGVPVPEMLPDFTFDVTGTAVRAGNAWSFTLDVPDATLAWQLGNGVLTAHAEGRLVKDAKGCTGHLTVDGTNTIRPLDEFSLDTFHLELRRDTPQAWTAGGDIQLTIFDRTCPLEARYDSAAGRLHLEGRVTGDPVPLPGFDDPGKAALGELDVALDLTRKGDRTTYSGHVDGKLVGDAFGSETTVGIALDTAFHLRAEAKHLVLADVARAVDIELPPVMPDVTGDYAIEVTRDASGHWLLHLRGDVSASTDGSSTWSFTGRPFETTAAIDVSRSVVAGKPAYSGCLGFVATGDVPIVEGVVLGQCAVGFSRSSAGAWTAEGGGRLTVFDQHTTVSLGYTHDDAKDVLRFEVDGAPTLHLAAASLGVTTMHLDVTREAGATSWELRADGVALSAGSWIELDGDLLAGRGTAGQELTFRPRKAELVIEPPKLETGVRVALTELGFARDTKGWRLHGEVHTTLIGLPDAIHALLARRLGALVDDGIPAELSAGSEGVRVEVKEFMAPVEIPMQIAVRAPGGDDPVQDSTGADVPDLDWGMAAVKASDLVVDLGRDPSISIDIGLALPSRLNDVFGTTPPRSENGSATDPSTPRTAKHQVFQVYDEEAQTGFTTLECSVSAGSGLGISLKEGFPIQTPFRVEDGKWWIEMGDGGEYGELVITIPEIHFEKGMFQAKGGYELTKKLYLPLTPLQQLLVIAGFPTAAQALPHKVLIPLGIDLIKKVGDDKRHWELDLTGIKDFLREVVPGGAHGGTPDDVLAKIESALHDLSTKVEMLPDRLCDYLSPHIPGAMSFALAVTPDGGVNFTLDFTGSGDDASDGAAAGQPLRFLYPMPTMPFPVLQGVALSKVSFGEVLGGSLFLLTLTADFDEFDVLSLAASLALQTIPVLPVTKDFHRHVIVHDLYCFVIYETGVPIPIPAFYDELGIDVLGVEGVNVQAHVRFALKVPGLGTLASAGSDLYAFFTDPTYALPEDHPPKVMPEFVLEDCYIELPGYLGGEVIGRKGKIVDIDPNAIFARLMNGVKFMTVADLLAVVPIEYRVNAAQASVLVEGFAGLSMDARWLIATPEEFAGEAAAWRRIGMASQAEAEALLEVAPGTVTAASDGLVVILMGDWEVVENHLDTRFVLVAEDSRTFSTSFLLDGEVGSLLDVHVACHLAIQAGSDPFEAEAHSRLAIGSLEVWKGDAVVQVDSDQITLTGGFHLLDEGWPIHAEGQIAGLLSGDALALDGTVTAHFFVVDAEYRVHVGHDGVRLSRNISDQLVEKLEVMRAPAGRSAWIKGRLRFFELLDYDASLVVDADAGTTDAELDARLVGDLVHEHVELHLAAGQVGQGGRFDGKAWLDLFDHRLFHDDVHLDSERFHFEGGLALFPDGFPINLTGATGGDTTKSGIRFQGGLVAKIGFITLDGPEVALDLAADHFVLHAGTWLSFGTIDLDFREQVAGGRVGLSGSTRLKFGPLGTTMSVGIVPGTSASIAYDTDVIGVVGVHAGFSGQAGQEFSSEGTYTLSVCSMPFVSGQITWQADRFDLRGGVRFGPWSLDLHGGLGHPDGLVMEGGYKLSLEPPWPISKVTGKIVFGVSVTVSSRAVGVTVQNPVGKGTGGIAPFRGRLCTLLHVSTPVKDLWIALPMGPGFPQPFLSRPTDWPSTLKATSMSAPAAAPRLAALPCDTPTLLQAIAENLGIASDDERPDVEALLSALEAYTLTTCAGGGPVTGGPWASVTRTRAADDVFTELAAAVGDPELDVGEARAVFEQDVAGAASGHMTMTLEARYRGEPLARTVEVDPGDIGTLPGILAAALPGQRGSG